MEWLGRDLRREWVFYFYPPNQTTDELIARHTGLHLMLWREGAQQDPARAEERAGGRAGADQLKNASAKLR